MHATILCCYAPPPVPPTQLPGTGGREDSWRRRRRPTTAVKKRQQSFVFSSSSFRFLHLPASVPPPPSLIWFFGSQQPLPPTSNRPFPFVFFLRLHVVIFCAAAGIFRLGSSRKKGGKGGRREAKGVTEIYGKEGEKPLTTAGAFHAWSPSSPSLPFFDRITYVCECVREPPPPPPSYFLAYTQRTSRPFSSSSSPSCACLTVCALEGRRNGGKKEGGEV